MRNSEHKQQQQHQTPQRENIPNISLDWQHEIEILVKMVPFHLSNQPK